MTAAQKPDPAFRTSLDRITARLAQALATGDIAINLAHCQRLEGYKRVRQSNSRPAPLIDDANRRYDMMTSPGQQAQQSPLYFNGIGGRQYAATDCDRCVSSEYDLVSCPIHRAGFCFGKAQRIGARHLTFQRAFINIGARDPIGIHTDTRQQFPPSR